MRLSRSRVAFRNKGSNRAERDDSAYGFIHLSGMKLVAVGIVIKSSRGNGCQLEEKNRSSVSLLGTVTVFKSKNIGSEGESKTTSSI